VQALIAEALHHFRTAQAEGLASDVEVYHFRLALDELLTNAIRHGASTPLSTGASTEFTLSEAEALSTGASSRGPGSPVGDGEEITLTVRYSKRGVTISVRDGGEGFAVEQVPDPRSPERMFRRGGRGVWILKKLGKVRCQGGEVTITLTPDPSPIKLGRKERGELCTN
jgi:anti-sigma regulatory factor (Ser/Thr protein kinase)